MRINALVDWLGFVLFVDDIVHTKNFNNSRKSSSKHIFKIMINLWLIRFVMNKINPCIREKSSTKITKYFDPSIIVIGESPQISE